MVKKGKGKQLKPLRSIMPRSKKDRQSVELFGGLGVAVVSALVVSIFIGSSIDRYFITSTQYASVLASVLVDLANGDRSQNSVHALTLNPVLTATAQAKANDMAAKSYFAHVSPEGIDPWHWFKESGYAFDYAGENLAVDFSESGDVERAWMNSPTHRENILNPHFTEIGIAVAEGTYQGRRTTFVVQEFGAPSSSGVQERLAEATIPASPTQPATASSAPVVLGQVKAPTAPKKPVTKVAPPKSPAKVAVLGAESSLLVPDAPVKKSGIRSLPVAATAGSTPDYAPLWAHLAASPRSVMQYLYWALALLLIIALGVATEFELKLHHTRKAVAAGVMLSFMVVVFIAANTFVFTTPSVTARASMASVAAALE